LIVKVLLTVILLLVLLLIVLLVVALIAERQIFLVSTFSVVSKNWITSDKCKNCG